MQLRELDETAPEPARARLALPRPLAPRVVVPIARIDRASIRALGYARSISSFVTVVHVIDDREDCFASSWPQLNLDGAAELVILESRGAGVVSSVLAYVDALHEREPERRIAVVLAEVVSRRLWAHLLRDQTALALKLRLFFRPNTAVIDVPYHL